MKAHDQVSLLTNFSKLKFDRRFRCPFGRKECMPNLVMFIAISPPLSQRLVKLHDGVSLLTKFSVLKFDHRFGCPFDIQAFMPSFGMFRAIWTTFKSNSSKNARRSFTSDQFLGLKI